MLKNKNWDLGLAGLFSLSQEREASKAIRPHVKRSGRHFMPQIFSRFNPSPFSCWLTPIDKGDFYPWTVPERKERKERGGAKEDKEKKVEQLFGVNIGEKPCIFSVKLDSECFQPSFIRLV